jgi:hypothetical protein
MSILLTEKLLFLCIMDLQNIYCFINPNRLYVEIYVLDDLSSSIMFNYINDVYEMMPE